MRSFEVLTRKTDAALSGPSDGIACSRHAACSTQQYAYKSPPPLYPSTTTEHGRRVPKRQRVIYTVAIGETPSQYITFLKSAICILHIEFQLILPRAPRQGAEKIMEHECEVFKFFKS
jgi:hypothetical protein